MAARVISACGRGRVLVPLAFLPTLAGFALVAAIERVKITNAPGGAVVVASGFDSGGGVCRIHEVLQGSGTIDVTGTLRHTDACESSIAVFAKGRSSLRMLDPPWTHSGEPPLTLSLELRVPVALNVVVPFGATRWARADTSRASAIFNANRAGVVFSAPSVRRYTDAEAEIVGGGCHDVAAVVAAGLPLYDASALNVYYVNVDVETNADAWMGYNCFEAGRPDVIYISVDARSVTTLAHEIGHAFGLRGATGHTNPSEGNAGMDAFTDRNLMYSMVNMQTSRERNTLSLGQVFRMNWDDSSLLNDLVPNRPLVGCQATATANLPCPKLSLDPEAKN